MRASSKNRAGLRLRPGVPLLRLGGCLPLDRLRLCLDGVELLEQGLQLAAQIIARGGHAERLAGASGRREQPPEAIKE